MSNQKGRFSGWAITLAAGVATVIVLVLLAWIGSELHYRNCLNEVGLRTAAPTAKEASGSGYDYSSAFGEESAASIRSGAISRCSRWP